MFTMTTTATMQIRQAAMDSGATEMVLRVAARQEADGSINYGMGFDDAQEGETPALLQDGVTVLIAPPIRPLLEGTVLDFVEMEPGEFRFIFVPPSAGRGSGAPASQGGGCGSGGCGSGGCGSSRGAV
jgi:iron-sulfur cluster assembly protein